VEEKEIVKQEIILAAQELFKHYGWGKTSVEDIAKKAGKGKSTLYYYFKNKEEIFLEVLMKEVASVCERMDQAVWKADTFDEKFRAFFVCELREILQTTNLYTSVRDYWIDNFMQIEEKAACIHKDRDIDLLTSILEKGIEEGRITHRNRDELHLIAETLIQTRMGFMIELARVNSEEDMITIEKQQATFLDLMLNGLLKR